MFLFFLLSLSRLSYAQTEGEYNQEEEEVIYTTPMIFTLIQSAIQFFSSISENPVSFKEFFTQYTGDEMAAEEMYLNFKQFSALFSQSNSLSEILTMMELPPSVSDILTNTITSALGVPDLSPKTLNMIVKQIMDPLKESIPQYIDNIRNKTNIDMEGLAVSYFQEFVNNFQLPIEEEFGNTLALSIKYSPQLLVQQFIQKITIDLQDEKATQHIIRVFQDVYQYKALLEADQWTSIINYLGIQEDVEQMFSLVEKYTHSENMKDLVNELILPISKVMELFLVEIQRLLIRFDGMKIDIRNDEIFRSIISVVKEIEKLKDVPVSILEPLAYKILELIESTLNALADATIKLVNADLDQPILTALKAFAQFIDKDKISVTGLIEFYGQISNILEEPVKAVLFPYVNILTNCVEKIYQLESKLIDNLFGSLKTILISTITELRNAYNILKSFIGSVYQNLIIVPLNEFLNLKVSQSVKNIITKYQNSDLPISIVLDAIEATILESGDEPEIRKLNEEYPPDIPSYRENTSRINNARLIAKYFTIFMFDGINIREIMDQFFGEATTEEVFNVLGSTIFNKTATVNDVFIGLTPYFIKMQYFIIGFDHLLQYKLMDSPTFIEENEEAINMIIYNAESLAMILDQFNAPINYAQEVMKIANEYTTAITGLGVKETVEYLRSGITDQETIDELIYKIEETTNEFIVSGLQYVQQTSESELASMTLPAAISKVTSIDMSKISQSTTEVFNKISGGKAVKPSDFEQIADDIGEIVSNSITSGENKPIDDSSVLPYVIVTLVIIVIVAAFVIFAIKRRRSSESTTETAQIMPLMV